MDFKQIQENRERKEKEIQAGYDSLNSYKERLIYIYNVLMTSQKYYLEYKNNTTFNDAYLNKLLSEINENISESEFADFINKYIAQKMNSGHVCVGAKEIIGQKEVPKQEINEPFKNNNVEISFSDNTVIIKIKSFSQKLIEKDAYLYENLEAYLNENDIQNIIIDIRGNGGGSDTYFKYFSIFTDENVNLEDNVFDLFLDEETGVTWTIIPAGTDRHYNKYLLVDENVFSTAEKLTKACRQSGYATVIGTPTNGEGLGFSLFKLQLTNGVYDGVKAEELKNKYGITLKQLILTYPTGAPINDLEQIDYENCYNTIPDTICPSEDALNIALNLINQKQK